jgi:cytochrome c
LPPGSGTALKGAAVYEQKCQACHAVKGGGQPNDRLVGGQGEPGRQGAGAHDR